MDENLSRWAETGVDPAENDPHRRLIGSGSIRESETVPDQKPVMNLLDDRISFVLRKEFVDADKAYDVGDSGSPAHPCSRSTPQRIPQKTRARQAGVHLPTSTLKMAPT
jgi:hypothetical protein